MQPLLRTLHSLSVALWFGTVAFFGVAALLIFGAFDEVSRAEARDRPSWFPLPDLYAREPAPEGLPEPLRREQGSRAAGHAVGMVFPVYYALQLGCAVVALLTAGLLARGDEGRWHRLRVTLCAVALLTVAAGWALERQVSALRGPRNEQTDALLAGTGDPGSAAQARKAFGMWHGINLLQSYATLALVAGLTVLLPALSGPARAR
jgi:hypothetical protein